MKLDADGARARHRGEDRQAAQARHGRGRAGDRRDRDRQDVARGARGVGRQGLRPARLRAGRLRRRRPAARLRDRARAAHPDRDRAAVPLAFLGARHAAGRRAPRFHPHRLFRSRQRRLRQARRGARRDGGRRQGEPAPRQGRASTRSSSTCATSARSSRCRCRSRSRSSSAATATASARPSTQLYEHRYAHHSPDEPVEMVNIRLGAIGKRPTLTLPAPRAGRRGRRPRASAQAYFSSAQQAARLPRSIAASSSAPARRSPGPALIQEHGTTTVLFERRPLHGRRHPAS